MLVGVPFVLLLLPVVLPQPASSARPAVAAAARNCRRFVEDWFGSVMMSFDFDLVVGVVNPSIAAEKCRERTESGQHPYDDKRDRSEEQEDD